MFGLIHFTWVIILYFDISFGRDYCQFSLDHMLCDNKGVHPDCGEIGNYIYKKITNAEIQSVLDSHNRYRNELALGKVTGALGRPYPKASDMEELKWDSELADVAAGMVRRCISSDYHCLIYKTCLQTDRHRYVGENIFLNWSTEGLKKMDKKFTFEDASDSWFLIEKDFYDPFDVPSYKLSKNSANRSDEDHKYFTQMIWGSTMRLGCAKITFKNPNRKYNTQVIITCHYAPHGNFLGGNIYEVGEPCSKCHGRERTCSVKYKGLCAAAGRPKDPDPPNKAGDTTHPRNSVNRSTKGMNGTHGIKGRTSGFSRRICLSKTVFLLCLSFLRYLNN